MKTKKLEGLKNEIYTLKVNTSKAIIGGMATSVEFVKSVGKKSLDKTYDTH